MLRCMICIIISNEVKKKTFWTNRKFDQLLPLISSFPILKNVYKNKIYVLSYCYVKQLLCDWTYWKGSFCYDFVSVDTAYARKEEFLVINM